MERMCTENTKLRESLTVLQKKIDRICETLQPLSSIDRTAQHDHVVIRLVIRYSRFQV